MSAHIIIGRQTSRHGIEDAVLRGAPVYPGAEFDPGRNFMGITWGAITELCRQTGLSDLFAERGGALIGPEADRVIALLPAHLDRVTAAERAYRVRHPDAVPCYEVSMECSTVARLGWLTWWMRRALRNRRPSIIVA